MALKKLPSGWACPECGRKFLKRTREHSCDVTSVETHLIGKSEAVRGAFLALRTALRAIGPHEVVPLKTMLSIKAASNFAGVRLTRERLDLEFLLARPLRDERIHKVQQLSLHTFAHHVRLGSAADVDSELAGWLREAHALGASGGRR